MKILLATSELNPFVKTGGLADMISALAVALNQEGLHVSVVLPYYSKIETGAEKITGIEIPIGDAIVEGAIYKTALPDTAIPVYLIHQPGYFHRDGIYNDHDKDYTDNLQRFTFFCRAAIAMVQKGLLDVDIVHANDWQTALIPTYVKTVFSNDAKLQPIKSVFTIHNLAYQGSFPASEFPLTNIGWEHFHMDGLEFYNQINLLKGGIVFSDRITTVSPTYAKEIQTPHFGCGLEGILQSRNHALTGILNGVDYSTWSPESDQFIAHQYNPNNALEKKPLNKSALRQMFNLHEPSIDQPLLSVVTRIAHQKGLDLLVNVLPKLFELNAQFVLLGSGDPALEERFLTLQQQYPKHCSVRIEYNEQVAHQIEAGADLFVMPSRYEPCGLNQMYSLRYGTIPIVHNTGGLADTIIDIDVNPNGNGFSFDEPSADALLTSCKRALAYYQQKDMWNELILRAMRQDYSWNYSAKQYVQIYEEIVADPVAV